MKSITFFGKYYAFAEMGLIAMVINLDSPERTSVVVRQAPKIKL